MINDIEKVFDLFEEQFEAEELKSLVRECKKMYIEKERLNNIINRIKSIYSSLCFSAPENNYIFIEQLGEVLQELKGSDEE